MNVYLDANAGLPMHSKLIEESGKYLSLTNPSNGNIEPGELAADIYDKSLHYLRNTLGSLSDTIVVTSGASESNATVLNNINRLYPSGHTIVASNNHPSIAAFISEHSMNATYCEVDSISAIIDPERTVLVCLNHVDSLNGRITKVRAIVRAIKQKYPHIMVLCDSTQAIGKVAVNRYRLGVDFLTFSAHKFGGPKGVGALLISPKLFDSQANEHGYRYVPLIPGSQQGGMRGGTLNVAGVAMMSNALKLALAMLDKHGERTRAKVVKMHAQLANLPGVLHVDSLADTTKTTIYFTVDGHAEEIVRKLSKIGFHVGTGCACQTAFGSSHIRVSIPIGANVNVKSFITAVKRCLA